MRSGPWEFPTVSPRSSLGRLISVTGVSWTPGGTQPWSGLPRRSLGRSCPLSPPRHAGLGISLVRGGRAGACAGAMRVLGAALGSSCGVHAGLAHRSGWNRRPLAAAPPPAVPVAPPGCFACPRCLSRALCGSHNLKRHFTNGSARPRERRGLCVWGTLAVLVAGTAWSSWRGSGSGSASCGSSRRSSGSRRSGSDAPRSGARSERRGGKVRARVGASP